jgi:hypothetical protein
MPTLNKIDVALLLKKEFALRLMMGTSIQKASVVVATSG